MAVEFSFGRGSPAPILMTIYILKNDTDVLYQCGRTVGSLTHFHRKFPVSKPGCNDMCKENLDEGISLPGETTGQGRGVQGFLSFRLDLLDSHLSSSKCGEYL